MKLEELKHVLVVGAGTMGQQISLQCALFGYEVSLYDVDEEVLRQASRQIEQYVTDLVSAGFVDRTDGQKAQGRIQTTSDAATAAQDADLLSESVPEDPAVKSEVFAKFGKLCPVHTIFTTNTSSFVPSMFAAATGRPAQFAALHFHNPVGFYSYPDPAFEEAGFLTGGLERTE